MRSLWPRLVYIRSERRSTVFETMYITWYLWYIMRRSMLDGLAENQFVKDDQDVDCNEREPQQGPDGTDQSD